jgi:hypothetical protein
MSAASNSVTQVKVTTVMDANLYGADEPDGAEDRTRGSLVRGDDRWPLRRSPLDPLRSGGCRTH